MSTYQGLRDARDLHDIDEPKILAPSGQSIITHSDWRIVNQMRAIRQHLGLGSILGTIAIVIAIGAPAVKQGEINGTTTRAVEALSKEQASNQAANEKSLNDAVARIEAGIRQAVDLGKDNQLELRSMRESLDRRIDQVANKADAAWNNMVELKGRVGKLEANPTKE